MEGVHYAAFLDEMIMKLVAEEDDLAHSFKSLEDIKEPVDRKLKMNFKVRRQVRPIQ